MKPDAVCASLGMGGFSGESAASAECLPGHARECVSDGGQIKRFEGSTCFQKDYVAPDGKRRGNTLILVREMKVVDNDFCSQFILSDLK